MPFDFSMLSVLSVLPARVAKLVDALCSGRSVRKDVLVRIQSRALDKKKIPYKLITCKVFFVLGDVSGDAIIK